MGLYKRGSRYSYDFRFKGRRYQGSTWTSDKEKAALVEKEAKDAAERGIPPASRRRGGKAGRTWKRGGAVSYFQYHNRVRTKRGQPQHCERCQTTDPTKSYDWANLTGKFDDVSDYIRLCRSCHRRHDRENPIDEATINALAFEKWWEEGGRHIDPPDIDEVSWYYSKRKELAGIAFISGVDCAEKLKSNRRKGKS